jgi:hypothetical protein
MAYPAAPIEWIPGRERDLGRWFVGYLLIWVVVFQSSWWACVVLLGRVGRSTQMAFFVLYPALIGLGIFAATFTYQALFPRPVERLGVWPGGVMVNAGWRTYVLAPWQLHVVGGRMFVLPKKGGLAGSWALTAEQVWRLRNVVSDLAPAT